MKQPSTAPAKPVRMTKTKRIELALQAAEKREGELANELRSLRESAAAREAAEKEQAEKLRKTETKVETLLSALKPFHEKTKDWERWPDDPIALSRKLTFGDVRRAKETYAAHK